MKREVAAEIVDSLKEAGVDFVASLTEANLHDLVVALGEDVKSTMCRSLARRKGSAFAPALIWAEKNRQW